MISGRLMDEIFKLESKYKSTLTHMLEIGNDVVFFFNHFNYNLIDSKAACIFAGDFLKSFGVDGILDSFWEKDLELKKEELIEKISIIQGILDQQGLRASVDEKYRWLNSFIDYQLGKENPLGFKDFSKI